MLSRPTVGSSLPSTAATSALPITANCSRCSARAVDVGAEVEHGGEAVALVRHHGRDRRPVDAVDGLQHVARHRHQRAGVAGRDAGLGGDGRSACGLDLARSATRSDESFLRRSADLDRVVHLDDFARRDARAARPAARPAPARRRGRRAPARPADARRERRGTPASVTDGPWSPPMQSTARRIGEAGRSRPPWRRAAIGAAGTALGAHAGARVRWRQASALVFSTLRPR